MKERKIPNLKGTYFIRKHNSKHLNTNCDTLEP